MSIRGRVARQLMTTPWVHPKTGGLYYRKVIPPRASHLFGGKVEGRRSLGTRDPRQARVRYAEIAHGVEAPIAAASPPPGPASHERLCALPGEWSRRKLAAWGPDPGAPREWAALAKDLHEDVKGIIVRDRRDRGTAAGGPLDDAALDRALFDDDGPTVAWPALAADLPEPLRTVAAEGDAIATGRGLHPGAASRDRLRTMAFRAALRLFGRMELRAGGDYGPDPNLAAYPALPAVTVERVPASGRRSRTVVTFASLVEGWALDRRPTEKARYTVAVRAGLLAKHLGHEDAARLTADDLRAWRRSLLEQGRAEATAANYLNDVKTLLRWAVEAGRLPANPAEGVRTAKRKPKAGERRLPFNDGEARLILEKARGLQGADRWIPWLLAFTGARVEEVAQALVADVRERDGIAYLDINAEGEGKSLKNAGSARRVPLHPALVAEGFLDYVAGLPRDGRLFPDLKAGPFGDLSAAYSKRAGRWVRSLGIADVRKVANHSWRHRFKDVCRDAGVAKDVHDRLSGHSEGDVSGGYGSGHALRTLAGAGRELPLPPRLVGGGYRG